MAVDLIDYADVLRRETSPPGADEQTAGADDDTLLGYLLDAFWEARLDGLLSAWTADRDGIVTPVNPAGVDLGRDHVALLVLYAAVRMLRNRVLNTSMRFRVVAGPVEYETQNSATVLADLHATLNGAKQRVLDAVETARTESRAYLVDAYAVRALGSDVYALPPGGP
jgi:hypothetical protein